MAKKQGQRLKILYILDFLKRESDEEHPVTAADICEYLDSQGIAAERFMPIYPPLPITARILYDRARREGGFWRRASLKNPRFTCWQTRCARRGL